MSVSISTNEMVHQNMALDSVYTLFRAGMKGLSCETEFCEAAKKAFSPASEMSFLEKGTIIHEMIERAYVESDGELDKVVPGSPSGMTYRDFLRVVQMDLSEDFGIR